MKPEFMRLRRAFATAIVVILAGTGLAVLAPLSASAHNTSLSGTAVCNTASGTYTVTYSGATTNVPSGQTATVTTTAHTPSSSSVSSLGSVAGNKSYTVTQTNVPGTATSASVSLKFVWPDGTVTTPSASVPLGGNCAAPPSPSATLNGSAVCNASTGTYTVTYSGQTSNASGKTASLSAVANAGGGNVSSGSSVNGNTSFTVTQSGVSGSATSARVTATLAWPGTTVTPSATVTLAGTCSQPPTVSLATTACVPTAGGNVGNLNVTLDNVVGGTTYTVELFQSGQSTAVTSKTITGPATSTSFTGLAPGTYHVTLSGGSTGTITSTDATIGTCTAGTPKITVDPSTCVPSTSSSTGFVDVSVSDLSPFTDYTVNLVAKGTTTPVLDTASTGTSSSDTTFKHTFSGVTPGDYEVIVIGAKKPVTSDTVTVAFCPPTLPLDPTLNVTPDQCLATGDSTGTIGYDVSDMNPVVTYEVTLTDESGNPVPGFASVNVPLGKTDFTGSFAKVPSGTYIVTAQSTDPASSAQTQSNPIPLNLCDLTTLAFTGPGAFGPLGAASALLLTLGGALVLARLRRRAAL